MFNSLRTKIFLVTLFILLVTNGVNSYVNGVVFKNEYSEALKNEVSVIGGSLDLQLDRLLALGIPLSEILGFEEQCRETVVKYPYIAYAMVVDTNGYIFFHSDSKKQNRLIADPQFVKMLKNPRNSLIESKEGHEKFYRFLCPVKSNTGSILGAVVLGLPARVISAKVSSFLFYSFLISFVFFVLAFFLLMFTIGQWVTKPLVNLENATKSIIQKGFLSFQKVAVNSKDEIGRLTQSFNTMAEELQITTVSKTYMDNIITNMIDGLFVVGPDFQIDTVNHAACEMTGYTARELIGRSLFLLMAFGTGPTRAADIVELINQGEWRYYETILCQKSGDELAVILSCSVISDGAGNPISIVITAKDITERKKAEKALLEQTEQLSYQATHDWLTGLYNRSYFEAQIKEVIEKRDASGREHILFYMDLDQFKIINDTCGHFAGDQLLREIAAIMSQKARKTDTLARLGGDEFGLLVRNCPLGTALGIAERICQAVQNYRLLWKEKPLSCGISIGVVSIDENYKSYDMALSAADRACYVAKEKGGNRFQIFDEKDQDLEERHGQMQLISVITKALRENRFCLHAQVIRPVTGEAEVHSEPMWYELLIRMLDDSNRLLFPGSFLVAAQRYNLMAEIDRWVISRVCSFIGEHPEMRLNARHPVFNVNISGATLTDEYCLGFILDQFDKYGINPYTICFEITETMAINNFAKAVQFIEKLKSHGCRFALDDFGNGLSSFNYLKQLPIDYLKIDGAFIRNITENHIDYNMVKGINEIAHLMHIETIAEYVENQEIFAMLKTIGVDYAQGYWIAKPAPIESVL